MKDVNRSVPSKRKGSCLIKFYLSERWNTGEKYIYTGRSIHKDYKSAEKAKVSAWKEEHRRRGKYNAWLSLIGTRIVEI